MRTATVAFIIAICFSAPAAAHAPGMSSANLRVSPRGIDVVVTLSDADLRVVSGTLEGLRAGARFEGLPILQLEIDGDLVAPSRAPEASSRGGETFFHLRFEAAPASRLRVVLPLLERLPRGHRQYVRVERPDGELVGDALLDARSPSLDLPWEAPSAR